MKSSKITSKGNRGRIPTVKQVNKARRVSSGKFVIQHIHRLRPNFEIGSLVGRNSQW